MWSKTLPTVPGYYWWKPTLDWKPSPQELWLKDGKLMMWGEDLKEQSKKLEGYWWSTPITLPT